MTKQERIQEAYGEHWETVKEFVDENGWCSKRKKINFEQIKESFNIVYGAYDSYSFRPKSLNGIENNNGWIKIESEDDLPNEDCHCWIMDKEKGLQSGQWRQAPNELLHKQACFYWIKKATHYQPIIKPQPPIY